MDNPFEFHKPKQVTDHLQQVHVPFCQTAVAGQAGLQERMTGLCRFDLVNLGVTVSAKIAQQLLPNGIGRFVPLLPGAKGIISGGDNRSDPYFSPAAGGIGSYAQLKEGTLPTPDNRRFSSFVPWTQTTVAFQQLAELQVYPLVVRPEGPAAGTAVQTHIPGSWSAQLPNGQSLEYWYGAKTIYGAEATHITPATTVNLPNYTLEQGEQALHIAEWVNRLNEPVQYEYADGKVTKILSQFVSQPMTLAQAEVPAGGTGQVNNPSLANVQLALRFLEQVEGLAGQQYSFIFRNVLPHAVRLAGLWGQGGTRGVSSFVREVIPTNLITEVLTSKIPQPLRFLSSFVDELVNGLVDLLLGELGLSEDKTLLKGPLPPPVSNTGGVLINGVDVPAEGESFQYEDIA